MFLMEGLQNMGVGLEQDLEDMPKVVPFPNRGTTAWAQQDNSLKGPWSFRAKEKVQCLCEGGRVCTREDPERQKGGNAISGLHSSWVGDQQLILATARPWQENIVKLGLVDVFIKHNIGMILNLQEVGEHDGCGPGNLSKSGFSYDPETFMAARIGFYNFSWRDMGVPDLDRMMDIVQVMDYVTGTEGRKILVHCHAGLGRTGLAIACYFLYTGQYGGRRAVEAVRKDRPGALQTRQQEMFVVIFEQYLAHLRCLFSGAELAEEDKRAGSPPKLRTQSSAPSPKPGPSTSNPGDTAPARRLSTGGNMQSTSAMGAPTAIHHAGGLRYETYDSGLQIVRPVNMPTPGVKGVNNATLTEKDIGLDHGLPWTQNFHIQPQMYTHDWQPVAPRSYSEALKRQQRLVHGPERRTYLHLHRFVKECVFAVIAAVGAHTEGRPGSLGARTPSRPSSAAGAGGRMSASGQQHQQQPNKISQQERSVSPQNRSSPVPAAGLAMPVVSGLARPVSSSGVSSMGQMLPSPGMPRFSPTAPSSLPPPRPPLPPATPMPPTPSNASLQQMAASSPSPDSAAQHRSRSRSQSGPVAESTGSVPSALGEQGAGQAGTSEAASAAVASSFVHAVALCIANHSLTSADQGVLTALSKQPGYLPIVGADAAWPALQAQLLHVKRCANFGDFSPLSSAPVMVILMALEHMFAQFDDTQPALSVDSLKHINQIYDTLPYEVEPGPEAPQVQSAFKVFEPMSTVDQELLLLFSAMLRHMVGVSGDGCEEHVVAVCKWVLRLLLGRQLSMNRDAEEAMLSFLWYLLRNDVAYAALVLAKKHRIDRRLHKGISTPASSPNLTTLMERGVAAGVLGALQHPPFARGGALAAKHHPTPAMPRQSRTTLTSISNDNSMGPHDPAWSQPQPVMLPSSPVPTPPPLLPPAVAQFYYPDEMPISPGVPPGVVPPPKLHARAPTSEQTSRRGVTEPGMGPTLAALPPFAPSAGSQVRLPPMPRRSQGASGTRPPSRPRTCETEASTAVTAKVGEREVRTADPRLYGPGGEPNPPTDGSTPLKSELAGIPSAYIPPTSPGVEKVVVHDVWI